MFAKKGNVYCCTGVDTVKRGRGRPKLTWDESVKRDLKKWNISTFGYERLETSYQHI